MGAAAVTPSRAVFTFRLRGHKLTPISVRGVRNREISQLQATMEFVALRYYFLDEDYSIILKAMPALSAGRGIIRNYSWTVKSISRVFLEDHSCCQDDVGIGSEFTCSHHCEGLSGDFFKLNVRDKLSLHIR